MSDAPVCERSEYAKGSLRNRRPYRHIEGDRTFCARIFESQILQIEVLQQVDLIPGIGAVGGRALDFRHERRRTLEPGHLYLRWAVHDQVSIRRAVPGPILKEIEKELFTGALALVDRPGDALEGGHPAWF